MKHYVLSALDRLGIEVNRSTTLRRFLAMHPIDLIVDAGANVGQFARQMRRKGYHGRIWSFEPVSDVFNELSRSVSADPMWCATRSALGSSNETKAITVPANHTLSSFLAPSDLLPAYDGHHCPTRTETVTVQRLDDVLRDDPATSIMLKMDVQGFEREVLEGARQTLNRTHAIYIELPIEHLYRGGWTFPEAIAYLDGLGFVPAQFRSVSALPDDRSSAVEFDCLLRRKSPA